MKSTFPVALGAKITGVGARWLSVPCTLSHSASSHATRALADDKTFASTGEAFSTVLLPNAESTVEKKLQSDDVSLGARFATSCYSFNLASYAPVPHSQPTNSPRSSPATRPRTSRRRASTYACFSILCQQSSF